MKILHVIRGLANSSGTTHIVGPLSEAQARLGHEVSVYHVSKRGERAVEPDAALVTSTEFPMTFPSRHYGYSRALTSGLRKTIKQFDVVHIHAIWNYVTWSAMRIARRAGVPYMVAPQGSLEDWALGRSRFAKQIYANLFEKPLFQSAAAMQALTQAEVLQCHRYGLKTPVKVLPNGVDLDLIDQNTDVTDMRSRFSLSEDEKIVVFLGRIFPKKGIDILASGFSKFLKQRGDTTLVVAGHDAGQGYTQQLQDDLKSHGGASKAVFVGEVRGHEKFQLLRAADLFVLPSYSEGLPVAVLEAMAVSTPVLITPGCNVPEVAEHEAGWICQPTAESFCEHLLESLGSDSLAERGRNARNLVEDRFTWPKIAEASINAYQHMSERTG